MRQHGVYKYVIKDTEEIIYIGKTDTNFKRRIDQHNKGLGPDAKFIDYKDKCDIYIAFLPNSTESYLLERALINQYKPVLNGADNQSGFSSYIHITEPVWVKYKNPIIEKVKKSPAPHGSHTKYGEYYLGLFEGNHYYLNHVVQKNGSRKNPIEKIYLNNEREAMKFLQHIVYICNQYGSLLDNECVIPDEFMSDYVEMIKDNFYPFLSVYGVNSQNSCIVLSRSFKDKTIHFNPKVIDQLSLVIDKLM